jgi:signal transduction histidine kinase
MGDKMLFDERRLTQEHYSLARELLSLAQQDLSKNSLLYEFSRALARFSGCESVDIRLVESERYYEGSTMSQSALDSDVLTHAPPSLDEETGKDVEPPLEMLCRGLLSGEIEPSGSHFTPVGNFFTGVADEPFNISWKDMDGRGKKRDLSVVLEPAGPFKSLAAIVFNVGKGDLGLLLLKSSRRDVFSSSAVEFYENIAQFLGVSIIHQQKQLALRERVKELTCLYGIARLVDDPELSISGVLESAVKLLPPAWLYPEITSARIVMDGGTFHSAGFSRGCSQLRSDIVTEGRKRGFVEVTYNREMPELDEGPFLQEERNLLDAVAKELLLIAEKYRETCERAQLQEQLRHADRLATIGQLSAGVAHELNEPLGGILGFAELCEKNTDIPEPVRRDLEKIVAASLHAREIVRKLMLFARQTPPEETWVSLNMLIADGLYFIESRCQKSGIELVRELEEDLPEITADPGQVYQVLINLAVNGIQAMPQGGRLIIRTASRGKGNLLVVEDNGTGMSKEVQESIFTPFFTTKDVGEGTGLGLSVVEGIVSSHGGSITVESTLGIGTKFTVYWPSKAPKPHALDSW